MLNKINKVKNLGLVFKDFTWDTKTPCFKKVNLFYGWNGCGKTTLTRLFNMLASGDCGDAEFELEDDKGQKIVQGHELSFPVKVFNEDYVNRNISVEHSAANTISILLGDENKELAEQVKQDVAKLNGDGAEIGLLEKISQEEKNLSQLSKKSDKAFTDIARTISAAIAGSSAASRTYRAPNAKSDYDAIAKKNSLPHEELEQASNLLRQEVLPEIQEISGPMINLYESPRDTITMPDEVVKQAKTLCEQTVSAVVIERLQANPDIAEWVAHGMDLHAKHDSKVCEYCGNVVSVERLNELAGHFNDADRKLRCDIDQTIADLRQVYSAFDRWRLPDQTQLYPELRASYNHAKEKFSQVISHLLTQIEALGNTLKNKQLTTTSKISLSDVPGTSPLSQAMLEMNKALREHNAKTNAFDKRQKAALAAIKGHYLSTIQEEVEANKNTLQASQVSLDTLKAEASETEARLNEIRAQISSAHKACDHINSGLHSFLGRDELVFSPGEESKGDNGDAVQGYKILRHGEPAVALSEGEKTAIALIYFLVHLQDGQSPISEMIVVIDDPISSLDSNSMYQAFSFLKNAVKDCHQVFIFTHNFDFLRQLLNWRSRVQKHTGYYMLKNAICKGKREALICSLDETLQKYETEYLFLFKTLREQAQGKDETILATYPVPNMARKLWDSFIMFRVPIGGSTYARMNTLKEEGFDSQKIDAIYKFTNDQSHITGGGFDPALIPESEKALAAIFDIMKQAAPKHYELLERSLNA